MEQVRPIWAVVVVYNIRCQESQTCQALKKLNNDGIRVIIYDNSTKDMGNCDYCRDSGWVYLGGNGNMGISKAYNACIDYLKSEKQQGLLCLFDDDTELDGEYFEKLIAAYSKCGEKIFVPLIFAAGSLISPCILKKGHRVVAFKDEEQALAYSGNELSAINSCMAIDLSVFDDYRYDENIFLDGVDHYFTTQMREKGIKITVFDYRCNHAFSGTERPPKESAKIRFGIYAKDYKYILKNDKLSYLRLVGKRALSLCVKYKTLEFLKFFCGE